MLQMRKIFAYVKIWVKIYYKSFGINFVENKFFGPNTCFLNSFYLKLFYFFLDFLNVRQCFKFCSKLRISVVSLSFSLMSLFKIYLEETKMK